MPAQKRYKTKYPGVYYIQGKSVGTNKTEKIYYIVYRKKGKQIDEKAGRQYQDDMTPARAASLQKQNHSMKLFLSWISTSSCYWYLTISSKLTRDILKSEVSIPIKESAKISIPLSMLYLNMTWIPREPLRNCPSYINRISERFSG